MRLLYSPSRDSHPRPALMGRRRVGYTLIEMIMTLSLIAIVGAISLPRLNFTQFRQDAGARLVRSQLQLAERLAITKQHNIVVSFDLTKNRIRVLEDSTNDEAVSAGERVTWRALEEGAVYRVPPAGIAGAVSAKVVGAKLKTIDGMPSVVYHRNGVASTPLEVYIGTRRAKGNDFRAVLVTQSTGRADWYRYTDGQWRPAGQ